MEKRLGFFDLLPKSWWMRHILFWIFILNYFTWGFGIGVGSILEAYIRNAKFIPGHILEIFLIKLDLKLVDDEALPGKIKNAETRKYDLEMPAG